MAQGVSVPKYEVLFSLVAKGGDATVYAIFTREQFADFAAKVVEVANRR
jgi:hypothetical protein